MEKFKLEEPTKSREKDAIEFIDEFIAYGSEINGTGGLNRDIQMIMMRGYKS